MIESSVNGVALMNLAPGESYPAPTRYQVTITNIVSGVGTVTFKARVASGDALEPVLDDNESPISISLPAVGGARTVLIRGFTLDQIEATSDAAGGADVFDMLVGI